MVYNTIRKLRRRNYYVKIKHRLEHRQRPVSYTHLDVYKRQLLGLMSFLTAGEPEVRAWTIKIGTKAPQAAGKIHTDIQKGFIRAEIVSYDDLVREGSMTNVKEKGLLRSEGKEYIMQEGDIVLFRFNV